MSTARTTEITLSSRASAYVALTKPDVSFLVLMTTAAGYYMGARGAVDWSRLIQTVFATLLIAAGTATLNHYIERDSDRFMRRTASPPLPSGQLHPREALWFGVVLCGAGGIDLYFTAGVFAGAPWRSDVPELFACLHAPQETDSLGDFCRCLSGSDSSNDWLGRSDGYFRPRSMVALCHSFPVAVPALLRYRLDVPRGLRARRHSDAAGSGPRRHAHFSPDNFDVDCTRGSQPVARRHGTGWRALLFRRACALYRVGASLRVGRQCENQCPRQVAHARHGAAHSFASGFNGL